MDSGSGGATADTYKIVVQLDASGAITGVEDLTKALNRSKQEAENAGGGFSKFQANLLTLSSAIELAKNVWSGFNKSLGAVENLSRTAADFDDLKESLDRFAGQAGTTGDALIGQLDRALGGTVDTMTLMKTAINELRLGLKPDEIVTMTQAARAYAEEGKNLVEVQSAITQALATGRTMGLKHLGILVDQEAAEKKLAAQYGKKRDELSAVGKLEATRIAVMDALVKKTKETGQITNDAADSYDALKATLTNLHLEFAKSINSGDDLNEIYRSLNQIIKGSTPFVKSFAETLVQVWKASIDLVTVMTDMQGNVRAVVDAFNAGTEALGRYAAKINENKWVKGIGDVLVATKDAAVDLTVEVGNVAAEVAGFNNAAEAMMLGQTKVQSGIRQTKAELMGFQTPIKGVQTAIQGQNQVITENKKQTDQAAESNKKMADTFFEVGGGAKEAAEQIKKENAEIHRAYEEMLKGAAEQAAGGDFWGGLFTGALGINLDANGELQTSFTQFGMELGGMLVNSLQGAMQGNNDAMITTLATGLGAAIGYFSGEGLLEDTVVGAAIGGMAGSLVTSIGDAIGGMFKSKKSEGTIARDSVEDYFNELFDAKKIYVLFNHQMVRLQQLITKGDTLAGGNVGFSPGEGKNMFSDLFNSLPAAAREAFDGVGHAFEELLGVTDEIGGQIGAILANNIGGNLKSLHILIEGTGKSLEEMKDAIMSAFKQGELSAMETLSAIRGIENVMQEGIPGATGAMEQALQNLFDAGSKGGAMLVDSIRDIGVEAKEVGITSLDQVAAYLTSTGKFTAEQINSLMQGFAQAGIDSVEELIKATDEQLLPALAAMEQSGALKETTENLQELAKTISDIPREKDIKLNVTANISDDARKVIDTVTEPSPTTPGQTPATAPRKEVAGPYYPQISYELSGPLPYELAGGEPTIPAEYEKRKFRKEAPESDDFKGAGRAAAYQKAKEDYERKKRLFERAEEKAYQDNKADRESAEKRHDEWEKAVDALKDYRDELSDTVSGSEKFNEIMEQIAAGTLSQADATEHVAQMYRDAAPLAQELQAAQTAYNAALERQGEITAVEFAAIVLRLSEAKKAMDNFGKSAENAADSVDQIDVPGDSGSKWGTDRADMIAALMGLDSFRDPGAITRDVINAFVPIWQQFSTAQRAYDEVMKNAEKYTAEEIANVVENLKRASEAVDHFGESVANATPDSITPDEFNKKVMADFLAGKIDAKEAARRMQGSNLVTGGGVPAWGDVAGAVKGFTDAGLSGGAVTLGMLRAIGVEAGQANMNMGQLLDYLGNTGQMSPAQLRAFKQVLAENDISSIDQLAGITDEIGLGMINRLSDVGYEFGQMTSELKSLLDDINNLNDTTVDIYIRVNYLQGEGWPTALGPAVMDHIQRGDASGFGQAGFNPGVTH